MEREGKEKKKRKEKKTRRKRNQRKEGENKGKKTIQIRLPAVKVGWRKRGRSWKQKAKNL